MTCSFLFNVHALTIYVGYIIYIDLINENVLCILHFLFSMRFFSFYRSKQRRKDTGQLPSKWYWKYWVF